MGDLRLDGVSFSGYGNGTLMLNGVNYTRSGGGNADYIECTQAQYDAWEQAGTLEEDTMYFITDGQSGSTTELSDLTDVDITSPTDGQLLRYNGTSGKWENAGIINDTTASASSVYSSNKTDALLLGKAVETAVKTYAANTSLVTAISDLITTYGKHSMSGGFIITGYGFCQYALAFSDSGQGGGWVTANNKGAGGNTPVLYIVQYTNGTVTLGYPWVNPV